MARKFATNIDLASNEIQNVVLQNLAAAPGSPKAGQFYYDTVKKGIGFYTGGAWVYPTESGGVSEAEAGKLGTIRVTGDLGGSGTSPTVVHFTLTSDSSAGTHKITALAEPSSAQDAATKAYVDGKLNGLAWKTPVKVATAAALPAYTASGSGATHILTANANGTLTIDGVAFGTLGQRVLVKNGASGKDNGVYTLTTKGEAGAKFVLTRALDFLEEAQILDATLLVEEGTEYSDHVFNLTNNPGASVVDTNELTFVEIQNGSAVVGDGSTTERTGNQIGVKGNTTNPSVAAEGAVEAGAKGGARKYTTSFTGNGALTSFTVTHSLETRMVVVQGMENNAGNPSKPIELDWETSGLSKVVVTFPTALTAGVTYFITVIG